MDKKKYDINKFIEFIIDLVNENDAFLNSEVDAKYYFTHGGCYELYKIVKNYFPEAICLIENTLDHCAIGYDNKIYDADGERMDKENFYQATEEDIKRLEDKFGLHIETLESPQIINDIEDCNIRGILTP